MADYEFRSSDLDFAEFLASVDVRAAIRERYAPMHTTVAKTVAFRHELQRLEAQVSPRLVREAQVGANRKKKPHARVSRTPDVLAAMAEIRRERGQAA